MLPHKSHRPMPNENATREHRGAMTAADKRQLSLLYNPPRARLVLTVAQAIPHASLNTGAVFSAAYYNTAGEVGGSPPWEVATPSRLYARRSGVHQVGGTVVFASSVAGALRRIYVKHSNGPTYHVSADSPPIAVGNSTNVAVSANIFMLAGEYIEIIPYQDTGASLNIAAASGYIHWESD